MATIQILVLVMGSEVTVKIKPYTGKYGTFAELIAVKVTNLVEYTEPSSDNEEF